MNWKERIIAWSLLVLLVVVLIAAENGVFDDTNYNEYDIKNVTDITIVNKVCWNTGCTVYEEFNGTCINRVGLTATDSIC